MTLFEFVSVMISIVLGLSLTRSLVGVANLARESRLVSTFAPHTIWVITLILAHFLQWWAVWDLRAVEWNYARFLVALAPPLMLFFATSLVFPGAPGGAVVDLEEYFFQIRRWLMLSYACLGIVWFLVGPIVFASEPFFNSYRLAQAVTASAPLVGLSTENRRVHLFVAWAVLLVILSGSVFRFFPGVS